MNPKVTTHLLIAFYSLILWAMNWGLSTSYDRKIGLIDSGIELRGLGAAAGCFVTFVCLRHLWKLSRALLDLGIRVPAQLRIWGDWRLLLYLAPLAVGYTRGSTSVADDGSLVRTVFEYGGSTSLYAIAWSASAIMLFQTAINLESVRATCEQNNGVHTEDSNTSLGDGRLYARPR